MTNQFYPTPSLLAIKAFSKFQNKKIVRLLEPSAGRGNLVEHFIKQGGAYSQKSNAAKIDAIEIDLENQAVLRDKGINVIDGDFMSFSGAGMYSHIIMNPPFNSGAEHVIKAFDLLIDGELVAIVNAETIRNPYTSKRKLLCQWIEQYGSIEFMTEAFMDPDTKRKTDVEIALIWLQKKSDIKGNFAHGLEQDQGEAIESDARNTVALRQSSISNAVLIFNTAVSALKASVIAAEEATYYKNLLGKPLNQLHAANDVEPTYMSVQESFNAGYDDLRKRAWTNVLHATEFNQYLSSKAYDKLTTEFEQISKLSFTESNIRAFLIGLVNSQGDMNLQMMLDLFDEITKYHYDNRAYYKGWKSNDKHKTQAYRVKMTRFILPVRSSYGWGPDYDAMNRLRDFDKAFAILDGKQKCNFGIYDLFESKADGLKQSKRMTTDYFDVRWYPGAGTLHFYPRNKKLIDRLNRLVGKERQWLPQDDKQVSKKFWEHYEKAEKITDAMVFKQRRYGHPEDYEIENAHTEACNAAGYDMQSLFALTA